MRFCRAAVGRARGTACQASARRQLVDRADQVLGVHDQHRRAVFHERAGGDVLDLAELRVERLHDQLALAEEAVDDQAVRRVLVAHDDHRQLVAGRGRRVGRRAPGAP